VPAAASPPPPPPPPPLPEGTTEAFSALDPEDSASLYKLYFLMGDLSVLCPQNGLFYIWTLQRLDDEEAGPLTGRWIETTTPPITRLHVAGDDGNFYEWIPELVDGVVTSSGRWLQTDCTCDLLTNVVQQTTDGKIYQWTPETLDGGGVGGRWKLIA
jgi:hypothetical protein